MADILERLNNIVDGKERIGGMVSRGIIGGVTVEHAAMHVIRDARDEIERLRNAIEKTLAENGHLADGDNCSLIRLKLAIGDG